MGGAFPIRLVVSRCNRKPQAVLGTRSHLLTVLIVMLRRLSVELLRQLVVQLVARGLLRVLRLLFQKSEDTFLCVFLHSGKHFL